MGMFLARSLRRSPSIAGGGAVAHDEAGADGVRADVCGPSSMAKRLGERDDRGLRGGVDADAGRLRPCGAADERLTIEPPPRSIILGANACVHQTMPSTLTAVHGLRVVFGHVEQTVEPPDARIVDQDVAAVDGVSHGMHRGRGR